MINKYWISTVCMSTGWSFTSNCLSVVGIIIISAKKTYPLPFFYQYTKRHELFYVFGMKGMMSSSLRGRSCSPDNKISSGKHRITELRPCNHPLLCYLLNPSAVVSVVMEMTRRSDKMGNHKGDWILLWSFLLIISTIFAWLISTSMCCLSVQYLPVYYST